MPQPLDPNFGQPVPDTGHPLVNALLHLIRSDAMGGLGNVGGIGNPGAEFMRQVWGRLVSGAGGVKPVTSEQIAPAVSNRATSQLAVWPYQFLQGLKRMPKDKEVNYPANWYDIFPKENMPGNTTVTTKGVNSLPPPDARTVVPSIHPTALSQQLLHNPGDILKPGWGLNYPDPLHMKLLEGDPLAEYFLKNYTP